MLMLRSERINARQCARFFRWLEKLMDPCCIDTDAPNASNHITLCPYLPHSHLRRHSATFVDLPPSPHNPLILSARRD
jgi:hypothetical protein